MRTIVSLTTYGERVTRTLPKALKSLRNLDGFDPYSILLYVTDDDARNIPDDVFTDNPNLTVVTVPDTRSYKKYTALTDRRYDNDFVFIFDDDIVLKPDTWVTLKQLYDEQPEQTCIYTKVCAPTTVSGRFKHADSQTTYDRFLFWSGRGVLIPPHVMRFDKQILDDGFKTVPFDDDTFFSVYCNANGIKCRCAFGLQSELDFVGNKKLYDTNKGNFKINKRLSSRYFKTPDSDRITVSTTQTDPKRIKALFDNQTLPPDKIIVNIKPNTVIPDGIKTIPNVTIRHDNPFTPDTDPDDLVFLIPDTDIPDNLIEQMFTRYYQSNDGYTHVQPVRFTHVPDLGHKPAPDMSHAVFRRRHADNMPNDPTPETFVRTIITNLRAAQLINNR